MKIEDSCQIPEKNKKRCSWHRIILNWTFEGKGPMSSVLSVSPFVSPLVRSLVASFFVSPFVSSIFFSESVLRIFFIFGINLGDNMELKMTYTECLKKNPIFLKSGKGGQT